MARWSLLAIFLFGCSEYRFQDDPDAVDLDGDDGPDAGADSDADLVDTGAPDGDDSGDTDFHVDTDTSDTDTHVDTDTSDTDTTADTGTVDTDSGVDTGEIPEIPPDVCDIAMQVAGWLDQYQVPNDGQVHYCHAGSGNYTLVTSSISSCMTHLGHNWDVFPATLCDS